MRYATTHDFCHEKGRCKNSCIWGLVKAWMTIFDLLKRQDILTHFWITHGRLQLSCLHKKLFCIYQFVSQQFCIVTLFYYQFMIKNWVIMNFSIDLPCSPSVGRYQSSQNSYSEVTTQLWVLRRLRYAFFHDFWRKNLHRSCHSANNPQCLGDILISINATL